MPLSPKGAAARLGLSVGRVRQLIASGALRAVNVGIDRPLWAIDETELLRFAALDRPGHRPRKESRMNTPTITGPVTLSKLSAWLETHRPHLALHEEKGLDAKGYYRRDLGPAASFHKCGTTWRDVAAELNAIEITD